MFLYANRHARAAPHGELGSVAMKYREFRDTSDELWSVWEVQPSSMERRLRDDPERRPSVERRCGAPTERIRVDNPQFSHGWLAFERGLEKRRLCPIPPQWESLTDAELASLASRASPTIKHRE